MAKAEEVDKTQETPTPYDLVLTQRKIVAHAQESYLNNGGNIQLVNEAIAGLEALEQVLETFLRDNAE